MHLIFAALGGAAIGFLAAYVAAGRVAVYWYRRAGKIEELYRIQRRLREMEREAAAHEAPRTVRHAQPDHDGRAVILAVPAVLYRLAVRCPACGARPARRITALERDLHRPLPAELVVGTEWCQGRGGRGGRRGRCGQIYEVRAGAYQQAEPDLGRPKV